MLLHERLLEFFSSTREILRVEVRATCGGLLLLQHVHHIMTGRSTRRRSAVNE